MRQPRRPLSRRVSLFSGHVRGGKRLIGRLMKHEVIASSTKAIAHATTELTGV
jgi:hypothetical protein